MTPRHKIIALIVAAALIVLAAFLFAFTTDVPDAGSQENGWEELRQCESSGNYRAQSGPHGGAYQFDQQTWESVGGSGSPAAASPAEQDKRAQILYSQRGSAPWPNCGRHLSGGQRSSSARSSNAPAARPARPVTNAQISTTG